MSLVVSSQIAVEAPDDQMASELDGAARTTWAHGRNASERSSGDEGEHLAAAA